MPYKVLVDDNYHYMDQSERYELGEFENLEAAIEAAKKIVDEFLRSGYQPGMTAQELYKAYTGFGEDPFIASPSTEETGVLFSAWDYAKLRCEEMCG